jgi:hypothetical protein
MSTQSAASTLQGCAECRHAQRRGSDRELHLLVLREKEFVRHISPNRASHSLTHKLTYTQRQTQRKNHHPGWVVVKTQRETDTSFEGNLTNSKAKKKPALISTAPTVWSIAIMVSAFLQLPSGIGSRFNSENQRPITGAKYRPDTAAKRPLRCQFICSARSALKSATICPNASPSAPMTADESACVTSGCRPVRRVSGDEAEGDSCGSGESATAAHNCGAGKALLRLLRLCLSMGKEEEECRHCSGEEDDR